MRIYLISLGAGLLVGIIYGVLGVRSPAPPIVALVGLFGILLGEQVVPWTRSLMDGAGRQRIVEATRAHLLGHLPGHGGQAGGKDQSHG
jgi:XapX domain-containing protein